MPAKVTLKVVEGKMIGQNFVFVDPDSCIIGRGQDCSPKVPDDPEHKTISRHHCLLDINPPDVRIRDFGSLNGTYVNGKKIGQREKGMTPEEGAKLEFPEHDLKDGDQIRLGETVFRVSVFAPARCAECSAEISEEQRIRAERLPGVFQCDSCRKKAEKENRKAPPRKPEKRCAKCGRDVANEVGDLRQGDYVCTSCKADPEQLMRGLLALAKTGSAEAQAIKGFSILRELGRGGMGAVYLARHDATSAQVALKVMLPRVAADARAKETFMREIENTKALKHPNVVEFRQSGCSNGTFFFTVEFCDAGSVDRLMQKRGGKLSIDEAIPIICDVLDGLEYAHHAVIPNVKVADGSYKQGRGLVHRDLSPHNILLHEGGGRRIAKLADFGLGKAFDLAGLSGHTRSGNASGKPWYMPRQQVLDFKHAKPEVDVWAAAASLYSMLTGAYPRNFPRRKDEWQVVLQSEAVPIRERNSSIPRQIAEVIDAALVDNPEIKFKIAASLKAALLKAK
jgi:serine/threonine-protein kinase